MGRGGRAVKVRILALVGLQAAVMAALAFVGARSGATFGPPWPLVGIAVAFALVEGFPMHLELRRHACTVTLPEAVLVMALFALGPFGTATAAALGEAAGCLMARQSPLKVVYNVVSVGAAASVAAAVFFVAGSPGITQTGSWRVVLVVLGCYSAFNLLSTSLVLAVAERRALVGVLFTSLPAALVATTASASVGLMFADLVARDVVGLLLVFPLTGLVLTGVRAMNAHRAERLRFERLYEASARSAPLARFEDALAQVATEARGLVTGAAAICCAADDSGAWTGMLVDDEGVASATPAAVDAIRQLAAQGGLDEVAGFEVPAGLRQVLPAASSLVLAASEPGSAASVVLAVFREIGTDGHADARSEVLTAFAGHAALIVANALLYQEVDQALRREVDLNRQKADFLAAVSHELRTPLTAMMGSVDTILRMEGRLGDADRRWLLDTTLNQGARLKRLIEELLLVAAAEHHEVECHIESVALPGLVREVVAELQSRSEGRVRVVVRGNPTPVLTDGFKLRQIVSNLVENAIKYAPSGPIDVQVEELDGRATISVIDHGPGIPEADRERVFERFVQLDQSSTRRKGGTGLGLYLCRQLATTLGSELTLTEAPFGGCWFKLTLSSPSSEGLGDEVKGASMTKPSPFRAGAPAATGAGG